MKKTWKWVWFAVALITVGLELLPWGIEMRFISFSASGAREDVYSYYSYFSLMPFGYADFAPMLVGILSFLCLIFSGIYLFKEVRGLALTGFILQFVIVGLSVLRATLFSFTWLNGILLAIAVFTAVVTGILKKK